MKQATLLNAEVSVWEERDRLHIHLFDGDENHTIAEWWDEEARQMIEDGFFKPGKDLRQSVFAYAISMQLIVLSRPFSRVVPS